MASSSSSSMASSSSPSPSPSLKKLTITWSHSFKKSTLSSPSTRSTPPRPVTPYPKFAKVLVILHGETPHNADGKYQGQSTVGLNDVGREQATKVANKLYDEQLTFDLHCSDSPSAYQTAQIISTRFGGLQITQDPQLRDRHLGQLEGVIRNEAPVELVNAKDRGEAIPGGGESSEQFNERCKNAFNRIAENNKGRGIVVVTHGSVLKSLYMLAEDESPDVEILRNASINLFDFADNVWFAIDTGDFEHLDNSQPAYAY